MEKYKMTLLIIITVILLYIAFVLTDMSQNYGYNINSSSPNHLSTPIILHIWAN
jgi:hypothetical protein